MISRKQRLSDCGSKRPPAATRRWLRARCSPSPWMRSSRSCGPLGSDLPSRLPSRCQARDARGYGLLRSRTPRARHRVPGRGRGDNATGDRAPGIVTGRPRPGAQVQSDSIPLLSRLLCAWRRDLRFGGRTRQPPAVLLAKQAVGCSCVSNSGVPGRPSRGPACGFGRTRPPSSSAPQRPGNPSLSLSAGARRPCSSVLVIVRFTPPARAQLLALAAHIHADRPAAARAFKERVDRALHRLVDFPESGRVIPEFPLLAFREVLVDSYRFFYRTRDV